MKKKGRLVLELTKRTHPELLTRMGVHYSHPKGFVGRSLCYAIFWDREYLGHIVGGSATRHLPGRNEFLSISINELNRVINNIFYNISPPETGYPCRNFTSFVVKRWQKQVERDWVLKYGDEVVGFETLVEKPRKGTLYKRAGWKVVGETKGYTCKRVGGKGTDGWGGKRVWNTEKLRPKWVLCCRLKKTL